VPKNNFQLFSLDQKFLKSNFFFSFIKTFDLVPKKNLQLLALDRKFKTIIKTFDLVPKFIKIFDLLPKKSFEHLPNLRQTFDLLKRSSEIRSRDQLPIKILKNFE
jgi:hypothetical protein